ncbi:MAG: hypothetical protein ACKO9Q_31380, partial [Pirellula sp.]
TKPPRADHYSMIAMQWISLNKIISNEYLKTFLHWHKLNPWNDCSLMRTTAKSAKAEFTPSDRYFWRILRP